MILKLQLPGLTLELNADEDCKSHYISVQGDYVHYKAEGYIFGYDGWLTHLHLIENALAGEGKSRFKISSIDEDFWFYYEPPEEQSISLVDRELVLTTKEKFWVAVTLLKDGAVTGNHISMQIDREEAQAVLNYFRFVKGELSEEETLKMVKEGFFK